VKVWWFCF